MSLAKESLFLFCVGLLGLAQANTSQIVTAVLLNEDGNPRCKIVQNESGLLSSERFDDFVETNPQVKDVLNQLDTLEECDNGDELYAEFVLNPQEISMSGVPRPVQGMAMIASTFAILNFGYNCAIHLHATPGLRPPGAVAARVVAGASEGILAVMASSVFSLSFMSTLGSFIPGKVIGSSLAYLVCEPQPRDAAAAKE